MSTRLGRALLDLLFPPRCVFCRALLKKGEGDFCAHCQSHLPWLTGAAAEQTGEFFARCVSPLRYGGVVRESLHRYKFQGRQGYATTYGTLLAQCIGDHLAGEYDLITWVPLSEKRRRTRGYDQAFLLAQAAATALGTAAVATLKKTRDTPAQSGIDGAAERRANVSAAYQAVNQGAVAGARILLVDDIVTTGATLSACAFALQLSGATRISCATVARAH